ncbi:MAG: hypothetical protein M1268_01695 [Patescibacteria group bacterium]|nr:hypothetical protein [Patescibacteria group bacterium]
MVSVENFRHKEQEEKAKPVQLAVLISNKGTGTNLQAVIDAIEDRSINASIAIVVSDKPDAKGFERVKNRNIPKGVISFNRSTQTRKAYGADLGITLNRYGTQIAILAGFSTVLPHSYFETFNGITINIHPGLLPDKEDGQYLFPDGSPAPWNKGLMTNDAVKNFIGLKYAGSTWHIVTEEADTGPVLQRVVVETQPEDTVETLYSRLKRAEHKGLIEILKNPQRIMNSASQL